MRARRRQQPPPRPLVPQRWNSTAGEHLANSRALLAGRFHPASQALRNLPSQQSTRAIEHVHEIAVRSRNRHLVVKPANPAKWMFAHKALKLLNLRIRRTTRRSLRIRNTPAQLGQIQQLDSQMVLELVAGTALRQPHRAQALAHLVCCLAKANMRFHRPICRFPRRRRRRRRPDEQMRELNGNTLHQLIARTITCRPLCPRSAILRRARNRAPKQAGQIAPKRRVKPNRFRAIHGAEQAVPEKRVQLPQSSPLIAIQHSHIKLPCHLESLQPYAISRRTRHPAARPAKPSKRPYRAERHRQSGRKPHANAPTQPPRAGYQAGRASAARSQSFMQP